MSKSTTLAGLRVLIVDDEDDIRLGLRRLLERFGADLEEAPDGKDAVTLIEREGPFDLVLTDLMMPHMSGGDLLRHVKQNTPDTEVVIFTGYGTIRTAVQCVRDGAAHFLTKPFDNDEICRIVERLGRQLLASRKRRKTDRRFIAEDPRMRSVLELIQRVATSPVPVLIEGESGTGKEVVAKAVHDASLVSHLPFQAVNTAALPDTLLESELFGHKKGAFTGAATDRDGLFVAAEGGSVFLDEIASMSSPFQGKLLRVLQEKLVRPLGSTVDQKVDFRLIAATNRDLEALCDEGTFRRDLFYRLGVVRIHIPPLRERPDDILPLARHFLEAATALCVGEDATLPEFTVEAIDSLRSYRWPGNVRELENAIQRAVIISSNGRIETHHLALEPGGWNQNAAPAAPGSAADAADDIDYSAGKQAAIERFQRTYLERALQRSNGNVSQAADECGMTRAALQRIMRQLGIDRSSFADA